MSGAKTDENGRIVVQVRLPIDLVRRLDHIAIDHDQYRQELVEELLKEALAARGVRT